MESRKQLCVDFSCPPAVSLLYTTKFRTSKILYWLCFGACEAKFRKIVVHAVTKCVDFFGSERSIEGTKKYPEKPTQKSNWIIGQISTILTIKPIELLLIIDPIKWTRITKHINEFTIPDAEIKSILCLTGHRIIRNGMIKEDINE